MTASALGDLAAGMGVMAVIVAVVVLAVLAILMPYYVYRIFGQLFIIRQEAQKTNALLRQIIKAYGHDPEA